MKTHIAKLFLLPVLIASLGLMLPGQMTAQTFTTLHSFTALVSGNNSDGINPKASLILSGNTLYGTAYQGGGSGWGTVFKVSAAGTGFTTLHSFTNGSDGAYPSASLILSGNTLYGTASSGGSLSKGTVFAINTNGTGFTTLYSFTNSSDGANPVGGLVLSGNTLYGTAVNSGVSGMGVVFKINTNGTGFTNLHSFTARSGSLSTNSDGANPSAGLILSGNILYGTAGFGGNSGSGTIFAVNTNGTGFTNLHSFTALSGSFSPNSDGAWPKASLILLNNTLYGTAGSGGSSGKGTVFAININGTGFTTLHSFTNSDGANPLGSLILSGNSLYGTAANDGNLGVGTVFKVNTDGSNFTNLYNFTTPSGSGPVINNDGYFPAAGLVLSDNTLYGTAVNGGNSGNGTVFSLTLPPPPLPLFIATISNAPVVFWPASGSNYVLQTTTNLNSGIWTTASNGVPLIGLQITNLLNPSNAYFRLIPN